MASRAALGPTPAQWAAKRQAAIEVAKAKKESERLGEITAQHTFRPALRSAALPHSANVEVNWQASATEWVAKRRATLKAVNAKKDAERTREAQSLRRRSPSKRRQQSSRCLKAEAEKPMERYVLPAKCLPQEPVDDSLAVVEEKAFHEPTASDAACLLACHAQLPSLQLPMSAAMATASPLRPVAVAQTAAHERSIRAKSPLKMPLPDIAEESLAEVASKLAAKANGKGSLMCKPDTKTRQDAAPPSVAFPAKLPSKKVHSPRTDVMGGKIAWSQIAVHTDVISANR